MDLICSFLGKEGFKRDCCIPFKGEACLLYLNVTEDMGLGPERLCSAAEGNKCTAPGSVVHFFHFTSLITLRRKTEGIFFHSVLMLSPEVRRPLSF